MVRATCLDLQDIEPHRVVEITQSTLAIKAPRSQPSNIMLVSWRPCRSQLAALVLATATTTTQLRVVKSEY
eukprot:2718776-Lingulodinium_polyedra.AAC.1